MGWFLFNEGGSCAGYSAAADKPNADGIWWQNDGSVPVGTEHTLIAAAIEDGAVVSVQVAATPTIYAHVSLSGGDGEDPPGVEADNALSFVKVSVKLSQSATDPDAGLPGGILFSGTYRIALRYDDAIGSYYGTQQIDIVDNVWDGVFRGTGRGGTILVKQEDMGPVEVAGVGEVKVILVGDLKMKIFIKAEKQ